MVGNLQNVVSAAVVVGAADKVNTGNAGSGSAQAAGNHQTHFDVKAANVQNEAQQAEDIKIVPEAVTEENVSLMTEQLNELMSKINCNLSFTYHQEVGVMSVKMTDKVTGEVIKELPPEDMIKNMINSKIWLGAVVGTFVDQTA